MRKERFVSDDTTLAVQMWTRFVARADASDTLFGPFQAGESFDYRGVIMYEIGGGRFTRITVAYNSFTHTNLAGRATELGMPHWLRLRGVAFVTAVDLETRYRL